ncbi:hypothetical protein K8R47_02600 [archaeon]|nr:hypothetical protein [archaeon]
MTLVELVGAEESACLETIEVIKDKAIKDVNSNCKEGDVLLRALTLIDINIDGMIFYLREIYGQNLRLNNDLTLVEELKKQELKHSDKLSENLPYLTCAYRLHNHLINIYAVVGSIKKGEQLFCSL